MTATELPDYPHTYKEQRAYERLAHTNRTKQIQAGIQLPPICGWNYVPRRNPKKPDYVPDKSAICMRVAGTGTDHHGHGYCDYHEVEAIRKPESRSQMVQNARKEMQQRAKFFGNPRNVDPHTALLEEIQRTAGHVEWLKDKIEEIGGSEYPDDALKQFSVKDGEKPSVWYVLYIEERKHLVSTCIAAIKAGVAERKVQIAEQQGKLIAAMMLAFMHDPELSLTPEQISIAPQLVRKHLLALPQQATEQQLDPEGVLSQHIKKPPYKIIETSST